MYKIFLLLLFLGFSSQIALAQKNNSRRGFDAEKIEQYKTDKKYDYERKVVRKPNSFLQFIGKCIEYVGRFIGSKVGISVIVLLIISLVLYAYRHSIFKRKAKKEKVEVFVETAIKKNHKNYSKLLEKIKKAEQDQNYKLAIRYLFVLVIKTFADLKIIDFHIDKTNNEYRKELPPNLQPSFKRLAMLFDYVWYGEYPASEQLYNQAKELAKTINIETNVA